MNQPAEIIKMQLGHRAPASGPICLLQDGRQKTAHVAKPRGLGDHRLSDNWLGDDRLGDDRLSSDRLRRDMSNKGRGGPSRRHIDWTARRSTLRESAILQLASGLSCCLEAVTTTSPYRRH